MGELNTERFREGMQHAERRTLHVSTTDVEELRRFRKAWSPYLNDETCAAIDSVLDRLDGRAFIPPVEVYQEDLRRLLRACGRSDGAQPESPHDLFVRCVVDVEDHADGFLHDDFCPTCRAHRRGIPFEPQVLLCPRCCSNKRDFVRLPRLSARPDGVSVIGDSYYVTNGATYIFISLSVLLVLATLSLALADGAEIGTARAAHIQPSECRYARSDGRRGFTDREVRRTIRCGVRHWPVPGGAATALRIANCESGFETTTSGSYLGVYQWAPSTWTSARSRFRALGRRWDLSWSALNGRANVTVAIKVASTTGWSPWSCY